MYPSLATGVSRADKKGKQLEQVSHSRGQAASASDSSRARATFSHCCELGSTAVGQAEQSSNSRRAVHAAGGGEERVGGSSIAGRSK